MLSQQPQWRRQQSGTTANLRGLWFVDSLKGWACGDSGVILHTSNGGIDWIKQNSGVNVALEDVFFLNSLNGWICGDSGTILNTTDAGFTWSKKLPQVHSLLRNIQFPTIQIGYSSGDRGTTLETRDSGRTWVASAGSDSGNSSVIFFWTDESDGTFLHNDTASQSQIHTIDGGRTWIPTGHPPYRINDIWGYRVFTRPYLDFYWDAGTHGFVVWIYVIIDGRAYGRIGQTGDTLDLDGVTLERGEGGPLKLWAVGQHGWIITSGDTGLTWQTVHSGVSVNLHEVSFPTRNRGWIVGDSGIILHYEDITGVGGPDDSRFPLAFALSDPYPNPFNASSIIQYRIPEKTYVQLTVYDVLGRELTTLVDEEQQAGNYNVRLDASRFSSGVYYYRLQAGTFTDVKKMILLK